MEGAMVLLHTVNYDEIQAGKLFKTDALLSCSSYQSYFNQLKYNPETLH